MKMHGVPQPTVNSKVFGNVPLTASEGRLPMVSDSAEPLKPVELPRPLRPPSGSDAC